MNWPIKELGRQMPSALYVLNVPWFRDYVRSTLCVYYIHTHKNGFFRILACMAGGGVF